MEPPQRRSPTPPETRSSVSEGAIPDTVWAPLAGGLLMLAAGLFGLAVRLPLLFPSLGTTAYLQAQSPEQPAARFRNVLVGHLVGLAAGFLASALAGAQNDPPVRPEHLLSPDRVWAAGLAMALTLLGTLALRSEHPASAATAMLVSVGALRTFRDALLLMAGVLIIALLGEGLRHLRLRLSPAHRARGRALSR